MNLRTAPWRAALLAATLAAAGTAHATEGEVRKIDRAHAKVTLAHGEIPRLKMPPMTMVYRARPPSMLDGLAVGDRVEFEVEKSNGQYVVTAIRKK